MQTNTTDQFPVQHIEYVSDQVAALEKATDDVADGKYASAVAAAKDKEDFEKRAQSFEADGGFTCFLSLNHGDFLTLMGFPAKVRQSKIGAALNVRLVIYEGTNGTTRPGFDRPLSLMKRLGNPELSATARKFDGKLAALAERVTAA
jgi:hypothetical protein